MFPLWFLNYVWIHVSCWWVLKIESSNLLIWRILHLCLSVWAAISGVQVCCPVALRCKDVLFFTTGEIHQSTLLTSQPGIGYNGHTHTSQRQLHSHRKREARKSSAFCLWSSSIPPLSLSSLPRLLSLLFPPVLALSAESFYFSLDQANKSAL